MIGVNYIDVCVGNVGSVGACEGGGGREMLLSWATWMNESSERENGSDKKLDQQCGSKRITIYGPTQLVVDPHPKTH